MTTPGTSSGGTVTPDELHPSPTVEITRPEVPTRRYDMEDGVTEQPLTHPWHERL